MHSDWLFPGLDFATWTMKMVISHVFFVLYHKLLTKLARLSHTREYWPLVTFVQTLLCSVHTAMTSGQFLQFGPRALLVRGYY